MLITIIIILLITSGIGLPLTLLIAPKHHLVGRLGLSYLLGMGIFTLLMYITNLAGLKLTFFNMILIFVAISSPFCFLIRNKLKLFYINLGELIKNCHPTWVEKIILGAITFIIISSFISTFYWPVNVWDALTLYDFRAHVFTQIGFIDSALGTLNEAYYYGYPLLTSLSHTIVYLSGGINPQFLYSTFYLSLALIFYGFLRDISSQKLSLLFTLILLTAPRLFEQSTISYTNLPYMVYFSLGVIYFYIWDKNKTLGYLVISSLLIGISTWTRSVEPFWLGIYAIILIISLYRKRFFDPIIFGVFFFPIQQLWKYFQSSLGQGSSTISEISSSSSLIPYLFNFGKWENVLSFLYGNIFKFWGPLLVLFITASTIGIIAKHEYKIFSMIFITWALLAFFIASTFIFSVNVGWYGAIPDSAARISMVFYPLFTYTTALVIAKLVEKK